eukprot:7170771-Pyramimonas_sp.AAC.1
MASLPICSVRPFASTCVSASAMRLYLYPALRQKFAACGPHSVILPNRICAACSGSGAGAPA